MLRPAALLIIALIGAQRTLVVGHQDLSWRMVQAGVEHAAFTREAPGGGSWSVNVLRVDMATARLDVVRANDAAIGLERVSSIATRLGAVAAINGGYFRTGGAFSGDSTGTVQIDGAIWSEPDRARASVGIVREPGGSRLIFGPVVWQATIDADGRHRTLDGVNRARGANDVVAFTPPFGPATVTDATGIEVVVQAGRVSAIRDHAGSSPIPRDGLVVSARGAGADWLRANARLGGRVTVAMTLRPAQSSAPNRWPSAEDVLGAGPMIVSAGRVQVTDQRERMVPSFRTDLHPRTAIAALGDARALLLVADGRRPPQRVGMSLDDLGRLLVSLGARDAINLDGGGSTTMVVDGAIVNAPSDPIGERPVSDAIVVRPRQ